jgi:hypothetical protein
MAKTCLAFTTDTAPRIPPGVSPGQVDRVSIRFIPPGQDAVLILAGWATRHSAFQPAHENQTTLGVERQVTNDLIVVALSTLPPTTQVTKRAAEAASAVSPRAGAHERRMSCAPITASRP